MVNNFTDVVEYVKSINSAIQEHIDHDVELNSTRNVDEVATE